MWFSADSTLHLLSNTCAHFLHIVCCNCYS